MRSLRPLPPLVQEVQDELISETNLIISTADGEQRKDEARRRYNNARRAAWFNPVVTNLRSICGNGELCMYCSSNEPSQIEHYRPIAVFPEHAMRYDNYTWSCDICNRAKGDKFPPTTEPGDEILNPLHDSVWEHFFIDETFGRLIKRSTLDGDYLPRAVSTCSIVKIDRENIQIKRQSRYKSILRACDKIKFTFHLAFVARWYSSIRRGTGEASTRLKPFRLQRF